jgi:parallel beta-helix repeat protein
VSANDCIISDNIIIDSEDVGIALHQSFRNNIKNNVISNCPFAAIRCYNQSESNSITNNRITDCINGILVGRSSDQNIQNNMVSQCSKGIYLEEANNNYVARNQLFNNEQGMFVTYAEGNLITANNFIDNTEHAKFTTWLSPTGLQISNWDANYWDDSIDFLPKWIPGILFIRTFNPIGYFFPWGSIDWHPAEEPYNIEGL